MTPGEERVRALTHEALLCWGATYYPGSCIYAADDVDAGPEEILGELGWQRWRGLANVLVHHLVGFRLKVLNDPLEYPGYPWQVWPFTRNQYEAHPILGEWDPDGALGPLEDEAEVPL